jgi:hypothetical protein
MASFRGPRAEIAQRQAPPCTDPPLKNAKLKMQCALLRG